jgi:D-alanyl-D-alanine carboxypeptidase (penicillin-binding protein 5/6)
MLLVALLAAPLAGLAGPVGAAGAAAGTPGPAGSTIGGPELASRGVVVPTHARPLPRNLTARGWVLADLDTGGVLAARDAHGRYPPASTLKTLTALTLLPRLTDRRQLVTCTDADARIEGSRVGLVPHGRYTVDVLFQALLLMSGNDAANALARAAGGVPQTVALMNAEAVRLQAYDTHAATPSGLDGPGQATSAYDLALIARAGLHRADFSRYVAQRAGMLPRVSAKYPAFHISNQNRLLYNYAGAFGVKTGFTDAARHTFVGAAARHGRRLVVTFLHGERRPIDVWQQAAALLDWGFALPRGTPPVGRLVAPADPGAPGGAGAGSAEATATTATAAPRATTIGAPSRLPVLPLVGGVGLVTALAGAGTVVLRRRRRTPRLPGFRDRRR